MSYNNSDHVVINQIYVPSINSFMKKSKLAIELDISEDTIDKWVKESFLQYNVHYFMKDKVIRYYYPAIKILLIPEAANQEI